MRYGTRWIAGIAASATLLLTCAPAVLAKSPPVARYDCYLAVDSAPYGVLSIKPNLRYVHEGVAGRYSHARRRLRFQGGLLDGTRGRWVRLADGSVELRLRYPGDDVTSVLCAERLRRESHQTSGTYGSGGTLGQ